MWRSLKPGLLALVALINVANAQQEPAPIWKSVELEWEAVENAVGYEVRLTPKDGGATRLFPTQDNHLTQELPTGVYTLEVRSHGAESEDFSPWSKPSLLEVAVKEILPLYPEDGALIDTEAEGKQTIAFKWTAIDQIRAYTLKVWSEDHADKPWQFVCTKPTKQLDVPPGQIYHWQVSFESANETSYQQEPKTFTFTIQGSKLLKPELSKITDPTPKQLSWTPSADAKSYHTALFYRHLDETQWTPLQIKDLETAQMLVPNLKPGAYKVEIVAEAPHRLKSDAAISEFIVKPSEAELNKALQSADL
jgi:hypothetical protein